jgi:hypothetical protein
LINFFINFGNQLIDSDIDIDIDTTIQLILINQIDFPKVSYDAMTQHALFKNNAQVIQAMERSELISVEYVSGHPVRIAASKPIYQTVFERILTRGAVFDYQLAKTLYDMETKKVHEYENELNVLHSLLASDEPLSLWANKTKSSSEWWFWRRKQEKPAVVHIHGRQLSAQHPLLKRYQFVCARLTESQKKVESFWEELDACKRSLA